MKVSFRSVSNQAMTFQPFNMISCRFHRFRKWKRAKLLVIIEDKTRSRRIILINSFSFHKDVIGVCKDVGELQQFTAKASGRELKKRDVTLVDNSNAAVNVTLWGNDAEAFNDFGQPVLLIKSGKINEFNGGKSISLLGNSVLKRNPDCVEGHRLRGWFDNGGASGIQMSVSARTGGGNIATEWLTFHEAKLKNLGNGDKPDYYQVKATVHLIRNTNAFYKACPQADCNKKVVDLENGQYSCEKCGQQFSNFKYRLMVNVSFGISFFLLLTLNSLIV